MTRSTDSDGRSRSQSTASRAASANPASPGLKAPGLMGDREECIILRRCIVASWMDRAGHRRTPNPNFQLSNERRRQIVPWEWELSNLHDDLAARVAGFEMANRVWSFSKRVGTVDDRCQPAAFNEPGDELQIVPADSPSPGHHRRHHWDQRRLQPPRDGLWVRAPAACPSPCGFR